MSGWSEIGSARLIRLESPGYKGPETKKPVSENRFFCLLAERESVSFKLSKRTFCITLATYQISIEL